MNDNTVGHGGEESEDGEDDTKDGDGEGERRQPGGHVNYVAGARGQAASQWEKFIFKSLV